MKTWVKTALIALAIVLVLLVGSAEWALHHVDRYLPDAIAYIQKKTGKKVEIRHATVGLFPLAVRLYGVGIPNPKPFPKGYFLQIPSMRASVAFWPLLHGTVTVRKLVLQQPTIDFISDPDGLWNFQNPGTPTQSMRKMRFRTGSISVLQVQRGKLLGSALIDPADTPGPVVLEIDNFSGTLKRINFREFKGHPNATIAGHVNAATARFGDIHVSNLQSAVLIAPHRLTLKGLKAKTYRGKAGGDFTLDLTGKDPVFRSDLKVSGIGMPYLLHEFQSGPSQMTGMMQADLTLGGAIKHTADPLADISGAGTFLVRNGELPSLNGVKAMTEMKRFRKPSAASKPVSAFSTFGGDIELKNHRMINRKLGVDFYGVAISGDGSLDEKSGQLDYTGVVTIEKKQGFFTRTFARLFKDAKEKNGRLIFPIRLAGTLSHPKFSVTD